MVVFLADPADIQARQLHRRIANRFQTDGYFEAVQLLVAEPRDPGPYWVVARTDPKLYLDDETYPVTVGRIEVGFERRGFGQHVHYWLNWIEPERDFLLGWHQDDDHPDLGQVHVQVTQGGVAIDHLSATVVDAHPMGILNARLEQLDGVLSGVSWHAESVTGIDW